MSSTTPSRPSLQPAGVPPVGALRPARAVRATAPGARPGLRPLARPRHGTRGQGRAPAQHGVRRTAAASSPMTPDAAEVIEQPAGGRRTRSAGRRPSHARRRASSATLPTTASAIPGVVRLDLTVQDEKATHRPRRLGAAAERAGEVRHRGDEPGRARPHRAAALDRPEPVPPPQPVPPRRARSTSQPRRRHPSDGRLVLRRARQRRPPADRLRRAGADAPRPTTRSRVAAPSWPPWTPGAASTTG